MNFADIWNVIVQGFLPAVMPFIIVCFAVSILCSIFSKQSLRVTLPLIMAFGFLGGVTGLSVGLSRVPVTGVVLPAMLTFASAVLAYVFAKENDTRWKLIIPFCLIVLSFNSLLGLFVGSQMRGKHEDYERQYNEWLLHYEKVDLEIEKKEGMSGQEHPEEEKPKEEKVIKNE